MTPQEIEINKIRSLIIAVRKDYKLSQKKLGQYAGVSQTIISNFESGKVDITLNTLFKITHALNIRCNLDWNASNYLSSPIATEKEIK